MPFPRPLSPEADVSDLASWLTEWSLFYPSDYDEKLLKVARPPAGGFVLRDLKIIIGWKSEVRFVRSRQLQVQRYDAAHPGAILRSTTAALTAAGDAAALQALRGIPNFQRPAFGSALLMVADPDRWTTFDRMANESLVRLRDTLAVRRRGDPLHDVCRLLGAFRPNRVGNNYPAQAADWPIYMECCRAISTVTWLSLRTIDRALFEARGR